MEKKLLLIVVVLAVVVLITSSSLALDPMGPPAAGLKQGELRAGADYMFSSMGIEADGVPEIGIVAFTIKDVKVNKGFANIGLGITENLEIFLLLGGASLKTDENDNPFNIAGYLDSGSGFAAGGGAKATLFTSENDKIKWGMSAQVSCADLDFDKKSYSTGGNTITLCAEVSFMEAQFAFGPNIELSEGFSLYGGPLFRIVHGDADVKSTVNGLSNTYSADITEDSIFFGYIGTHVDIKPKQSELTNGFYLFGELQFSHDSWGLGTGFGWKF
jgi:hypothetical protein